jgi:hypothetical protein
MKMIGFEAEEEALTTIESVLRLFDPVDGAIASRQVVKYVWFPYRGRNAQLAKSD